MLTKIAIAKKLTVPSDKAWEAIGKIGRLDVWFPTIATCKVEGDGVGALRHMTLNRGGDITDRIVDIDQAVASGSWGGRCLRMGDYVDEVGKHETGNQPDTRSTTTADPVLPGSPRFSTASNDCELT